MLTVLVTRPAPEGEELCDHIRKAGFHPVYFPTIEIKPIIHTFNHYDIIIFVSPQAVYQSAKYLPDHVIFAAIGPGTANAMKKSNLPTPVFPAQQWNSEGLLDLPLFQHVKGKKIAIVRGETGRELLKDTLVARGASVENVIAYRRELPKTDMSTLPPIDVIVCTSNEIVKNLVTLMGIPAIPLLVISERMVEFAKNLGFKQLFLAKNASHDAIMTELVKQKDYLCQRKK